MSYRKDLKTAKELRAEAKTVQDPDAKEKFLAAAARHEKRAAKGVGKTARIKRKPAASRVSSERR